MSRSRYLALVLVGVAAGACATREKRADPQAGPPKAVLFLSAEMHGYLGPCGCSENMRGGVHRAAFQVLDARKQSVPVLYIDAGDALFGHQRLAPAQVPQQERKARALAEAFGKMGLAAKAVGELDRTQGEEFRKELGLPELTDGEPRLLDANGRKVGVVAAATGPVLLQAAARARADGAEFVVGLLHRPMDEAQKVAEEAAGKVDLVVAAHARDELAGEENRLVRGAVPTVQVQSKGRSLLRVDLTFAGARGTRFEPLRGQADAERELAAVDARIELLRKQVNEPGLAPELLNLRKAKLEELIQRREQQARAPASTPAGQNGFTVRFIPLESNFPVAPEVKEILTAYDKDVGLLNLAWAREHGQDCRAPANGEAAFVGSKTCRECHEEAFAVFEASKHARAYKTLEEAGKNNHLDCVSCHVTGWQRPGGVCRIDKVTARTEVGCESCHGPGSLHLEDPTTENVVVKNEPKDCVGCHDAENSPHFEFEEYRLQILGPGHGQPLPDAGSTAPSPLKKKRPR